MRVSLASVYVDDQEKALDFYTEVLEFEKNNDLSAGEARWVTVVSPDGTELVLEPNDNPVTEGFQEGLFEEGVPLTTFDVDDAERTYRRLEERGVDFHTPPTEIDDTTVAVFEDTCGNLIQISEAP